MLKVIFGATGIILLSNPILAAIAFDTGLIMHTLGVKIGKDVCVISTTIFVLVTIAKGVTR